MIPDYLSKLNVILDHLGFCNSYYQKDLCLLLFCCIHNNHILTILLASYCLDDVAMHKDLEIGESEHEDLHCEKLSTRASGRKQSKLPEVDIKPFDSPQLEPNNKDTHGQGKDQATSLISAKANRTTPQAESRDIAAANGPLDDSYLKDKGFCDCGETPGLELSLKRLSGVEDGRSAANEDCNVLRHSDFSAFSKYSFNFKAVVEFTFSFWNIIT